MLRTESTMTPDELRAWIKLEKHNTYTAGPALGISRETLHRYLAGSIAIPETVAKLAAALTKLRRGKTPIPTNPHRS